MRDGRRAAATRTRAFGLKVTLDAAPAVALNTALEALVDLLDVNAAAGRLVLPTRDERDARLHAARRPRPGPRFGGTRSRQPLKANW